MQQAIRTVHVGVIGLGTVGGGTVRLIQKHRDSYLDAYGIDIEVTRGCALDAGRAAELGLTGDAFTSDWRDITSDPDIDIVVELIGGEHPATEIFEDAFAHGKHVVSANKALLGKQVGTLAAHARAAGVQIRCEAACGGGIPIVNALEHALVGNKALTIAGIVNGTTNYILSRMDAEGLDFADVLADAQRLGYAEADPTADVDGFDAASKLAILSSIAFHTRVTTDDVYMQGIRNVSAIDIEQARELGMKVKLLAVGRNTPAGVDVRVHPTMIPADHQLAAVNGAMNAVYMVGDAVGETMFYGAGAGAFPTASAVVGDILELARPLCQGGDLTAESEPYAKVLPIRPIDDLSTRYYIRLALEDRAGALAPAISAFEQAGVSLSSVRDVQCGGDGKRGVVLLTNRAQEHDVTAACAQLAEQGGAVQVASLIRIEDMDAWTEGVEAN